MSSRRQYNMPPTEDTREALLEDTAPSTRLLPWAALACLGAANAAEAVEVLCASYLLKGLKGAPARAAVSSGVYAGMLVGGVGGGLLGGHRRRPPTHCEVATAVTSTTTTSQPKLCQIAMNDSPQLPPHVVAPPV